ncbi:MAG: hypothetical protein ACXVRE_08325 [Gaiellaceae bacterium]
MRKLLVVLALLAFAASASAGVASAPFQPSVIKGSWKGTWHNLRFGSTGPASIKATVTGKGSKAKLRFTVDFGGNVFGCADPAPESSPLLRHGKGNNHWNAAGFVVKANSQAFGALKISFKNAGKKLSGAGGNPPCNQGLTWVLGGKFAGAKLKTFTGLVNITLPDQTKAVSQLALTKS